MASEQEYFTWVDAQGRIHNSPKPPSAKPSEPPPLIDQSSSTERLSPLREGSAVVDSLRMIPGTNIPIRALSPAHVDSPVDSPVANERFLSEADFEKQQQQYETDNPAFFIWIDAQGTRHVQTYRKSDEVAAQAAQQEDDDVLYDHLLAMPLRNVDREGVPCCESFRSAFRHRLVVDERLVLSGFRERLFNLNDDDYYQAWYVQLGAAQETGRDVSLKIRNTQQAPMLLALNAQWQPLHLIAPMVTHHVASTWASRSYQESRLHLDDGDIHAVILFFLSTEPESTSIDLRWTHAKTPH